jgi:hypothetical protein
MIGKCCLSIFDFISKNVVVFQKGFFCQDLRNLITRQEFPMRNLLRQRKCSGEPIVWTLCIYTVISKCVQTLFFGTSPVALGLKKYLWFWQWRNYYGLRPGEPRGPQPQWAKWGPPSLGDRAKTLARASDMSQCRFLTIRIL